MAGYNDPQPAKDSWAKKLYQKYELGEAPTMKDIEPVATRLLGDVQTAHEGAELVLGRCVDSQETDIDHIATIYLMGGSAPQKFALLRMWKATEPSL